jgi:hypothetical protein
MKLPTACLVIAFLGVLSSCGQAAQEKPYVYELVTLNVGKKIIVGVKLYYGDKFANSGSLQADSKQTSTIGFFESPTPYPTKITYEDYKAAEKDPIYVITDIKIVGQLQRGVPGQKLVVEIDPDNKRATCTVK